jgi:hypothetical protein
MASTTPKRSSKATKKTVQRGPRKDKPPKGPATPSGSSASEKVDTLISELNDWRGEMLAELRKLIHEADPDVVEEWKWMGSPVWSHDGIYAVGNAHKGKVKVTFSNGAALSDPKELFNAGFNGKNWRAIDLREGDKISKTAFKELIREAVHYNTEHSRTKDKN